MKKKNNKLNLIICGFAFVVMLLYIFCFDGVENLVRSITTVNFGFLLLAVCCIFGYWVLESVTLHLSAKSIAPQARFKDSLFVTIIGQYFNSITPFASGGQPMQAYYYVKRGIPLSAAMTALISRFIVYQFVLTVYSVIFLIFKLPMFREGEFKGLTVLVVIGFLINTAVILLLFMVSFFRTPTTKLAHGIVYLLGKLRIFKNPEEKIVAVDQTLEQYYEHFLFIKSKPLLILKMCALTFVQLFLYFSITYVIYLGFGMNETDLFTITACQSFVLMISSFVPLPGALGAAEGSYAAFFSKIFGSYTGFSTFVWRFLTFYLPILIGLGINLYLTRRGQENFDDMQINSENQDCVRSRENTENRSQ